MASKNPRPRHCSFTGTPLSASRRKPTICSSLNRFFTSKLRPGLDSKPNRYSKAGRHHPLNIQVIGVLDPYPDSPAFHQLPPLEMRPISFGGQMAFLAAVNVS